MFWKNGEQYSDYTAGEALCRTLARDFGSPGEADDEGCRLLIAAIVRQAADDHLSALRGLPSLRAEKSLKETAAFFRSDYFHRLTGIRGDAVLRIIRKEMKNE